MNMTIQINQHSFYKENLRLSNLLEDFELLIFTPANIFKPKPGASKFAANMGQQEITTPPPPKKGEQGQNCG